MPRATLSPIIDACLSIARMTDLPVGDGVAPTDCEKPYIVVVAISSPKYSGPMDDWEADSKDRIQFSSIGETREQADSIRDDIRLLMTFANLDAEFVTLSADRRTLTLELDVSRGSDRDDRGLPNPIFNGVDQYMIETTPL